MPIIVDFRLVLATRLSKRYKLCLIRVMCLKSLNLRGDMSKIKNGVPWKELRQKEVIQESRKSWIAFSMKNLND